MEAFNDAATIAGLSSFHIDMARFPEAGGTYTSPDFDTVQNRVAIQFRVGVSSIRVR
ncbi:MAG: hypothetical protein HYU29_07035 [Chloroflexi bacterium]|nr:hypothetical protein [Chloroflexota bacterium]